MATLTGFSS